MSNTIGFSKKKKEVWCGVRYGIATDKKVV